MLSVSVSATCVSGETPLNSEFCAKWQQIERRCAHGSRTALARIEPATTESERSNATLPNCQSKPAHQQSSDACHGCDLPLTSGEGVVRPRNHAEQRVRVQVVAADADPVDLAALDSHAITRDRGRTQEGARRGETGGCQLQVAALDAALRQVLTKAKTARVAGRWRRCRRISGAAQAIRQKHNARRVLRVKH